MCKATQISPTTVIAMYAASVRRNGSMMSRPQLPPLPVAPVTGSMTGNGIVSQHQAPRPNGFHVSFRASKMTYFHTGCLGAQTKMSLLHTSTSREFRCASRKWTKKCSIEKNLKKNLWVSPAFKTITRVWIILAISSYIFFKNKNRHIIICNLKNIGSGFFLWETTIFLINQLTSINCFYANGIFIWTFCYVS